MHALIYVIAHSAGPIEVLPDCAYIVNGWQRQRQMKSEGTHAELWAALGAAVAARPGGEQQVRITKVTAHQDKEEVIKDTSHRAIQHFIGNAFADTLADRGATFASITGIAHINDVTTHRDHADRVLARALVVHGWALDQLPSADDRPPRAPRRRRNDLERAMAASGHHLCIDGSHVECGKCRGQVRKAGLRRWLAQGPCPGPAMPTQWGEQLEPHTICLGKAEVDISHQVLYLKGIAYCAVCGAFARASPGKRCAHKLSQPCGRTPTRRGITLLNSLRQGLVPVKGMAWPAA